MATNQPVRLRRISIALLTVILLAAPFAASWSAQPSGLLKDFGRTQLIIVASINRCILFDIYIAASRQQRAQGLMHIRQMDTYEGMIFLYSQPAQISMWMKNTLIPLDMLFLDRSGKIVAIHTGAVPMSEEIIKSGVSVTAVLELNAGAVEQFGLQKNDRVIFPENSL
jgi:hypothetical protein